MHPRPNSVNESESTFIDVFPLSAKSKFKLETALAELESIPGSFCGCAWLNTHHFLYASSQVELIVGYHQKLFVENGLMFIHSITPPQYINPIYQEANKYIQRLKTSGLGLKYEDSHVVEGALRTKTDRIIPIRHVCCFIDCNNEDLSSAPFLAVGIWIDTSDRTETRLNELTTSAKKILVRIKEAYWELYPGKLAAAQSFFVKSDSKQVALTPKEKEVLILLSSGHTSKEIGVRLDISFHTVESHRKHLIRKFAVKNSVELLAKVHAVYSVRA